MAKMCKCGHKKSNHDSQRDYGRYSGKCRGDRKRIDEMTVEVKPCSCREYEECD